LTVHIGCNMHSGDVRNGDDHVRKRYDYIVVGSGAAGAVVAARLAEDPRKRVLVLEAGPGDRSVFVRMPAALAYPLTNARRIWSFETGPEPALGGRVITQARGRMLGGSTSLNGMVYVRGNRLDYDSWAKEGLAAWSYAHCLPYFKRLERYDGGSDFFRGREGPIGVTSLRADLPIYRAFLEAGQQAGHRLNDDYNGASQEGVHVYQANIDRGIRASTGRAYLRPAMRRGNVELSLNSLVHRVLFAGTRAVGVAYERGGEMIEAEAEAEVILAGGAFNTPHILLLSGVGPRQDLSEHGIPVVADVPGVGRNLQDHVVAQVRYRAGRSGISPAVKLNLMQMGLIGAQWLFLRSGLGTTNIWETGSFFKSSPAAEYVNIQHEFLPMLSEYVPGQVRVEEGLLYQTCLMRPRSRGAVTLRSADPRKHPAIVFNYLADPQDRRDLMDGIRHTDEIIQMPAWNALRGEAVTPNLRKMPEADLWAWLRENAGTQYHPCGTCRMGTDDLSVVDEVGRVREVDALRVVDASVIPRITSGNLNCPTMMIAEKLADAIRGTPPLPPATLAASSPKKSAPAESASFS
jgi:choline dehydrogenase